MPIYENWPSKMIFLGQGILITKMDLKRNLRRIMKNHAADPETGLLTNSILKSYGRATAMPTALELKKI